MPTVRGPGRLGKVGRGFANERKKPGLWPGITALLRSLAPGRKALDRGSIGAGREKKKARRRLVKKRWLLSMAGLVLIASGVFFALLLSEENNPYNECLKRIKVGMGKEEAVRTLEEYKFSEGEVWETRSAIVYSYRREGEVNKIRIIVGRSDGIIEDVEGYEVSEEGAMARFCRLITSSF